MSESKDQKKVTNFFHNYAYRFLQIYKNDQKNLVERVIDSRLRSSMFSRFETTLAEIKASQAKTVLDVGCGPGQHDIILANDLNIQVTGIDIAENMIELANIASIKANTLNSCKFILGDFDNITGSEKFDVVFSLGVVEYIKDPSSFISKMCQVAQDKVIFSLPVKYHWLTAQRMIRYRIRNCPLWFYSEKEIISILKKLHIENYLIHDLGRDYLVVLNVKNFN